MARRVFFSFHHQGDILRVGQVRNSWLLRGEREDLGFVDSAEWESIKRNGDAAVKRWIETQLNGTSVTVVLIGQETANRPWVIHEIIESHNRGNGLIGIKIHNIKDLHGRYGVQGPNPFDYVTITSTGRALSQIYPIYDWVVDNGYQNMPQWIEDAARKAGR